MLKRRWTKFVPGLALGVCSLGLPSAATADVIVNGGFESIPEDPGYGGTVYRTVRSHFSGRQAQVNVDGTGPRNHTNHFVVLTVGEGYNGHLGTVEVLQTLHNLSVNQAYRFSLSAQATTRHTASGLQRVFAALGSANARETGAHTFAVSSKNGYQRIAFTTVAKSKTEVIRFGGEDILPIRYLVDNLAGAAVPELDERYGLLPLALAAATMLLLDDRRKANQR